MTCFKRALPNGRALFCGLRQEDLTIAFIVHLRRRGYDDHRSEARTERFRKERCCL